MAVEEDLYAEKLDFIHAVLLNNKLETLDSNDTVQNKTKHGFIGHYFMNASIHHQSRLLNNTGK
jgi:hypothetical protein